MPSLDFFFGLLNSTNWVVMDHLRYHVRSEQNQCRIRTPTGVQVLRVAVKHPCNKPIYRTMINNYVPWKLFFLKRIKQSYRGTEFFDLYYDDLRSLIEGPSVMLETLNMQAIMWVAGLLNKNVNPVYTHFLYDKYPKSKIINHICEKLHAEPFQQKYEPEYYPQISEPFEEGLSVLDTLFSVGAEDTRKLLTHGQ